MRHLLVAAIGSLSLSSADAAVLIKDVTVVDASRATNVEHRDVLLEGDRISRIAPAGIIRVPRRTTLINGSGRFLIAGLWDAHVHLFNLQEPNLGLLIADGITSVRDMGGNMAQLRSWVRRIDAGILVGPRIEFCGPMLEAPGSLGASGPNHWPVASSSDARRVVWKIKSGRAQCIKVRTVKDLKTYLAIGQAAKAAGLPLFGHPPFQFDPEVAAPAGQRTYEHAFYPYPFAKLSDTRRRSVIATFLKQHVMLTPTLVAWMPSQRTDADRRAELDSLAPEIASARFIGPGLRANWLDGMQYMKGRGTPGWEKAIRQAAADVHAMFDAGVPILAGTDLGAPFVEPATALYQELELLVSYGGFTPAQALTAATLRPAELFGLEALMGTVEAGKVADLVLLQADPIADIHNIRSVETVIARGVIYRPIDRDRLKHLARQGDRRLYDEEQITTTRPKG